MVEKQTSKITTDHEEIKAWAEKRGGKPAIVKGTEYKGTAAGLLRIDFGEKDEALKEISWEEFFDTFDQKNLAFLYQEEAPGGKLSRFFKFINRE